ncbi:MAG: hypothetical protein HQL06_11530 [Nitrospirae bacterium]|nr:hypothetical protein [Nitrospirota bacterium]
MAEQEKVERYKNEILDKLREAGGKGVSKSGLGIKSKSKFKTEALKDLETNTKVVNLSTYAGNNKTTLYVLKEFDVVDELCGFIKGVRGATAFQVKLAFTRLYNGKLQIKSGKSTYVPLTRERVLEVYNKIKALPGRYSNIYISELQKELSVPMDLLKEFILKESADGKAILSEGDTTVASKEERAGAIDIDGIPHLFVSFEESK